MQDDIQQLLPEIINIRQRIHNNPELAYEEIETASLVENTLKKYGYEVTTNIGVTGVSAVLDSGRPGKTIALRADMDALPLQELTALPYQSKINGKMHACGHDGHTATLLAVAGILKNYQQQFKGKIKFIFQPAEEGEAGAAAMIKDGVLENPKVDAIFGYHNYPGMAVNLVRTRADCLMAGMDSFVITVKGKGGHAAQPDKAIDPIFIGSSIVQNLQAIVSRLTAPTVPIVISVTQFNAGTAPNIIPEEVTLGGTIRTTTRESQIATKQKVIDIATGIANSFGAEAKIDFRSSFPPTINSLAETDFVIDCARRLFGNSMAEYSQVPTMASEDFSYFLEKIPGCYFFIGTGESRPFCHSPHFDFNDEIIPIATALMATIAIDYLNK